MDQQHIQQQSASQSAGDFPPYNPQDYAEPPNLPPRQQAGQTNRQTFAPPPQRNASTSSDPNSPIHYTRDPHNLVAYLVPFPKPSLHGVPPDGVPTRFLIYTPPPPPLAAPAEGEKEDKLHKVQRKWQEEVRAAKTSDAKTASWKGVKSKATRGISKAMGMTKTSNLEFLNRITGTSGKEDEKDHHADDGKHEEDTTHKTVGLESMTLVYPASLNMTQDQLRQEFVDTMMRSKSKAERDAVIATGLLPVSAAIDIMATLIWPFGGLLEIDSVWAYSSIRGAKTSRSVTKRLTSTDNGSATTGGKEANLKLEFMPSPRLEVLDRYLSEKCHERDHKAFASMGPPPTESEVLSAIGWTPHVSAASSSPSSSAEAAAYATGGEELQQKNWEDEQWETQEVKDDLKSVMGKGAREWDKWCKTFAKDPEKAMKK